MKQNNEQIINELREKLYLKYDRKQLSDTLKVSENHISRLLNNQSKLSVFQYFTLKDLLK